MIQQCGVSLFLCWWRHTLHVYQFLFLCFEASNFPSYLCMVGKLERKHSWTCFNQVSYYNTCDSQVYSTHTGCETLPKHLLKAHVHVVLFLQQHTYYSLQCVKSAWLQVIDIPLLSRLICWSRFSFCWTLQYQLCKSVHIGLCMFKYVCELSPVFLTCSRFHKPMGIAQTHVHPWPNWYCTQMHTLCLIQHTNCLPGNIVTIPPL